MKIYLIYDPDDITRTSCNLTLIQIIELFKDCCDIYDITNPLHVFCWDGEEWYEVDKYL